MTIVLFVLLLLIGAYVVAVVEFWLTFGRFAPRQPFTSALALLGQESIVPRQPDRTLFESAPILLLAAAVLAASVLPVSTGGIVVDLATGALFINAALAYVMVAMVMAGWGADSAYALVAGWRFLGQLVAYSMLIVMPITAVAMRAQSLSTTAIVASQGSLWNIVAQPLGFLLFFIAAMMLSFLPPFDLPNASPDLAGGVTGEYTGMRLAVFRLGRLVLVATLATAIVVFYLGGWLGPFLPGWAWTLLKSIGTMLALLSWGRYVPRLRAEQVLTWSWKLGIPLALVNIAWVGLTLLAVR